LKQWVTHILGTIATFSQQFTLPNRYLDTVNPISPKIYFQIFQKLVTFRSMNKLINALVLLSSLLCTQLAHADGGGCIPGPSYSTNKMLHFAGTAAVSSVVTATTGNFWYGVGAGLAVGAGREIYKIEMPGMRCEYYSMAYDLVGSLTGAYFTHWYMAPIKGGAAIGYHSEF
jgi:hypothetical protein